MKMELPTCDQTARNGASPPAELSSLSLSGALELFQKEAQFGIFDNDRYRCPYWVWGEGPPLLWIHGLADDTQSFVLPLSRLSKHFRCIAYDLPNHQGDGARLGGYRHHHFAEDAVALLDHLNVERAYLFGSSFGSTIVLRLLHASPQRFPRAILQGGFAKRTLEPSERVMALFARYLPGQMHHVPYHHYMSEYLHRPSFSVTTTDVWDYYVARSGSYPMAAVARRALIMHGTDLRNLLPEIQQPVLLMCGEEDPLVGKDCEEVLMRGLPNWRRAGIEGCGHLPYFTHAEILAELVRQFLTPLPCQVPSPNSEQDGCCPGMA
ncbi:MAG: alpha/beta fold hydrolase [Gemmataceae bacterium]